MAKPHFDWKRFWTPLGESVDLNNGYLLDPDGKLFNRNALPLSRLSAQRCLALLGEPGMGKTTAMEDNRAELQHGAVSAGEAFLRPDLRICGTDMAVNRELFDTQEFESWRRGDRALSLFLDGFDECVLRVEVLVLLLLRNLRSGDTSRLRLRIACRTAEWPRYLHDGLAELYGEDFHVYELAPLRRIDVSKAAETYGLDVERFMTAVDQREVVPFATKPVTLNMLLKMFKASGDLPSDLAGLYKKGCEALCEEISETRTGPTTAPRLSPKQRVQVARRIAGIMALCQRTSILRPEGSAAAEPADLTIDDILDTGEPEKTEDGESEMTLASVKEVLDTGLFSGRGHGRLGWAHQTYSEFLASEYLQAHGFVAEQIAGLVMHPLDRSRVVPQLHGVAAWLAGKSQEVFDRICPTDPRVLLAADFATFNDDRKGRLLDSFLGQIEAGSAPFEWEERRHFRRLGHSALGTRLRPYIEGGSWSTRTRVVAIMIAEECGSKDLQELLIKIALDAQESIDVRIYAVAAIGRIADGATKLQLQPLAEGDPTDQEDRLKGEALAALSGVLSAKEIFEFMSLPAKSHHWSGYWVLHKMTCNLAVADLPDALGWAARFPSQTRDYYFEGPRNAVLRSAQDHLDSPAVLSAFASFARARMRIWEPIWNKDVPLPDGLDRRRLLQAIIDGECSARGDSVATPPLESQLDWWHQMVGESPLVRPEDLGWVVESFLAADPGIRACWAELLKALVLDVCIGTHSIDPVIEAAERVPELHDLLTNALGSIEIASDEARQLRQQAQARQQRPVARRREGPSLAERMALQLSDCERDVAKAFPRIVHHMAFGDEQTDMADPWSRRLREFPGWRDADDSRRRTVLEFGKAYLNCLDVVPPPRTGREFTVSWPARAAYLTLGLLEDVEPEWLSQSTPNAWQRWTASVVDFETWAEPSTKLLDRALDMAPAETMARFVTLITWEDKVHQSASIARRLVPLWNPRVEETLLALARAPDRAPSTVRELLYLLLSKESRGGIEYARSLLPAQLPNEIRAHHLAREAAVALLVRKPALGWPCVWPILTNHSQLGRDIAIRTAGELFPPGRAPWADALAPRELADLYLWLCEEFPHSEDPSGEEGGIIGGRGQVAAFRDSLLASLGNRDTGAAFDELMRISTQPGTPDMRHLIAQARQKVLEANWTSPTPQQLLLMARNHQKRWVDSARQMQEVVLESLARYQRELRGELPANEYLWNELPGNVWRPKDEDAISNHIARHLRQDLVERGVILNREVQIRSGPNGQRTDIHVDAVRPGGADGERLAVIIEVKGSWNNSLKTAMQEQLRDKYLKENDCRHGIYLVAWFNCERWDPKDRRCRAAKAWGWNLEEARAQLDSQAKSLSNDQFSLAAFLADARLG